MHILIVDDAEMNLKLIALMLSKLGHTCSEATDGGKAVEACRLGRFDCILMDIQMPEMDGIEATRLIREQEQPLGRRTPIHALTAGMVSDDDPELLAAGFDGVLRKPVKLETLRTLLEIS